MPAMPDIRSFDGTEIAYSVSGNGPVSLLFFHGWGGHHHVWDEVITHLDSSRFRCLAMDWRGHGQSACPKLGYTWEAACRDALAVADHAQAQQFIPVGFSMGARLACLLAAQVPRRIPALALVGLPSLASIPLDREWALKLCREAHDWARIRPVFRDLWFGASPDESLVDAVTRPISLIPRFVLEATAELSLWSSLEAEVGILQQPTLVIAGTEDKVCPPEPQRQHTLSHFANATQVVLPAAHFLPLEKPAEVAALISSFLVSIPRRS